MVASYIDELSKVCPLRTDLERRVLGVFKKGQFTSDEVAEMLKIFRLTSRPRVCKLAKRGYLEDTGLKRRNKSGRKASVWKIKKGDQQFLPLATSTTTISNDNKRNRCGL